MTIVYVIIGLIVAIFCIYKIYEITLTNKIMKDVNIGKILEDVLDDALEEIEKEKKGEKNEKD